MTESSHKRKLLLLLLTALLAALPCFCEEPPVAAEEPLDEISITAERMEMQLSGHTIELTGNILVQDSTMNLTANKMKVFLDEDNKLQRIEAEDNVTIRKLTGSESATGDRGYYEAATEKISLEGNCTLFQGKSIMNCEQITYDRKKQSIVAKGNIMLNIRDLKNTPGLPSMLENSSKEEPQATDSAKKDVKNIKSVGTPPAPPSVQEKK